MADVLYDHALRHGHGGGDEVFLDASQTTTGRFGMARMPTDVIGRFLKSQGVGVDPVYAALVAGDLPAHAPSHQAGGADDLESLLRLANFAERAHGSLTGVGASDHHIKTTSLADITDHDLAHHPLAIIPTMDDGHIPDLETLSYGGPFANAQIPTPLKDKALSIGLTADVAITANQVVYVSAANEVSPAATAHRSKVIGVALNDAGADAAVEVQVFGKVTVIADGAIAVGELVAAAPTAGRVVSLTSITPTFTGNALPTHGHTFTGSALPTHNHTFTGSALPTHGHTFTGSGGTTGTPSATTTVVTSVNASTGTPSATATVASRTHLHTIGSDFSYSLGGAVSKTVYFTHADSGGVPYRGTGTESWADARRVYHEHGISEPSTTATVASSTHTHTIGKSTGSVASSTHTHGFTPSGTISSVSAGTPSGSISSVSAGTPSGSINDVSAGTPSGDVSAIPLGQTIGRAITSAAGAGSSLTIVVVPGG